MRTTKLYKLNYGDRFIFNWSTGDCILRKISGIPNYRFYGLTPNYVYIMYENGAGRWDAQLPFDVAVRI